MILKINRKTVVRRFRFLASQARHGQKAFLLSLQKQPLTMIQFDDLETSEHTKCKPLSVVLAVEPHTRKILNFKDSQMPAKGRLAKTALRKYGVRRDQRRIGWESIFYDLKPIVSETATFTSDENPHYPIFVKKHFPKAPHIRIPGGRGASSGQGELKKKIFDPMFSLNHTCAMLRANLNRLVRRTWCTTKTQTGLIDHLSLYVHFHNRVLTSSTGLGAS